MHPQLVGLTRAEIAQDEADHGGEGIVTDVGIWDDE